jgi:hypothetical protein
VTDNNSLLEVISTQCCWKRFDGVEIFRQAPITLPDFSLCRSVFQSAFFFSSLILFACELEPDRCQWQQDFRTFGFHFFLSQNLPTLKKVCFAAVEYCQQICSSASASHVTRVKILKQIYETRIGEDSFPQVCTTYMYHIYVPHILLAHIRACLCAAVLHSSMCICTLSSHSFMYVIM